MQRTCVRVRTYVRTYVCNGAGSGDTYVRTYVHKGLEELLRHIKKQKSLIFCNQGVHRSGNGACMLMCAAYPDLTPCQAMLHLSQMRSISSLQQRGAYKRVPALMKWFDNGGPLALQATFLTTSPHPPLPPPQRLCNLLCFPPRLRPPRLRPPVARPVSPKPPGPAPTSLSAGGLEVCRRAGNDSHPMSATIQATIFSPPTHPKPFS